MAAKNTRAAAAADRKADAESGKQNPNKKILDALAAERQGYVTRGLADRVKQVDAQIKHYGGTPPTGRSSTPSDADKAAAEKAAAEKAAAEKAASDAGESDEGTADAADSK